MNPKKSTDAECGQTRRVFLSSASILPRDLKQQLEASPYEAGSLYTLQLEEEPVHYRSAGSPETIVLVAVVGAVGSGLAALLTGLLQLVKQRASQKILIQSRNGTRLEVPASTPIADIDSLIEKIREMDIERIDVS